jgi:hypothetical protein
MACLEFDVRICFAPHARAHSLDQIKHTMFPSFCSNKTGLLTNVTKIRRRRVRITPQNLASGTRHVDDARVPVAHQAPRRRVLDEAVRPRGASGPRPRRS